jgi:hypothetical protein
VHVGDVHLAALFVGRLVDGVGHGLGDRHAAGAASTSTSRIRQVRPPGSSNRRKTRSTSSLGHLEQGEHHGAVHLVRHRGPGKSEKRRPGRSRTPRRPRGRRPGRPRWRCPSGRGGSPTRRLRSATRRHPAATSRTVSRPEPRSTVRHRTGCARAPSGGTRCKPTRVCLRNP